MKREDVISVIKPRRRGTFVRLKYEKQLKDGFSRVVDTVVRTGVNYYNMKKTTKSAPVVEKRPWGERDKNDPFLINHKGNTYLEVALAKNGYRKVSYYFTDDTGERSEVDDPALIKILEKMNQGHPTSVFTINVDKITELANRR